MDCAHLCCSDDICVCRLRYNEIQRTTQYLAKIRLGVRCLPACLPAYNAPAPSKSEWRQMDDVVEREISNYYVVHANACAGPPIGGLYSTLPALSDNHPLCAHKLQLARSAIRTSR